MLLLKVLFTKLSKMNKQIAFIESYAMGEMFWPCYRDVGCTTLLKLISKESYSQSHIKNRRRTPCFFCWLTKWNGTFTKFCFWNLLITNETGGRVLQNKPYFCRPYCTALHVNSRCSCLVQFPPTKRLPVIVLGSFLSGDGIADMLVDRYFN